MGRARRSAPSGWTRVGVGGVARGEPMVKEEGGALAEERVGMVSEEAWSQRGRGQRWPLPSPGRSLPPPPLPFSRAGAKRGRETPVGGGWGGVGPGRGGARPTLGWWWGG